MTDFATYPSLAGRRVFITGGATGIGAALVAAFAAQGASVGHVDLATEAAAALADTLAGQGLARPWFRRVDVVDTGALQAAVMDFAQAAGGLDVLINNVANDSRHDPLSTDAAAWRGLLAVNLDAAFFAAQAAIGSMRQAGGGAIINVSSINALLGPPDMPAYVAAKSALIGLTRSLARQYGADGIRVNAILPGWVVTERQLALWLTPQAEADWMQQVALKRRILPEDVANLALFLAAEDSRMITGQALVIDGGRT
jgi:NAD(P)-dependent dehydrogenase (short-subunit alcohol dehydrogenase family)